MIGYRVDGWCSFGCSFRGVVISISETTHEYACLTRGCRGVVTLRRARKACCGVEPFADCAIHCARVRRTT